VELPGTQLFELLGRATLAACDAGGVLTAERMCAQMCIRCSLARLPLGSSVSWLDLLVAKSSTLAKSLRST